MDESSGQKESIHNKPCCFPFVASSRSRSTISQINVAAAADGGLPRANTPFPLAPNYSTKHAQTTNANHPRANLRSVHSAQSETRGRYRAHRRWPPAGPQGAPVGCRRVAASPQRASAPRAPSEKRASSSCSCAPHGRRVMTPGSRSTKQRPSPDLQREGAMSRRRSSTLESAKR